MISNFLYFYNIVFLLLTTFIFIKSFNSIINYRCNTIADYVICLIYAFNCVPVLCDITIGIPDYVYWYKVFEASVINENVSLVYNIYVALSMIVLCLYKNRKANEFNHIRSIKSETENCRKGRISKLITNILIVFPILYCFAKYGINIFLQYTSLSARGIEDSYLINFFISVSSYYAVTRFVKKNKKSFIDYLFFTIYFLLIVVINGKRYIIITLLVMMIFIYEQWSQYRLSSKRLNLKVLYTLITVFIISFSFYYFATVRSENAMSENMYATIRVDFGRDDVTKFVIDRELFQNKPILDYAGQTALSTIFIWVPRSLWPNKPYPHYRYLTSAILGVNIDDLPAGTTPSIYEQNIANFGIMGIFVTCIIFVYICKWADNSNSTNYKLLILLLLINLLTQAIDMALPILLLMVVNIISKRMSNKIIN